MKKLTAKQIDLMTRVSQVERFETLGGPDFLCARGLFRRKEPLVTMWCHDNGADITDVDAQPHHVVELTELGRARLADAMPDNVVQLVPRKCFYVPATAFVEGRGWRASVVVEGEAGHHPTGDWPYTDPFNQRMPYFWGPTYADASKAAEDANAQMGISPADAFQIVNSSMIAQSVETKAARKRKSGQ